MNPVDRIRPLDGPGARNLASGLRAPLDSGPIEPMRERAVPLLPSIVCAVLGAVALVYFGWRIVA